MSDLVSVKIEKQFGKVFPGMIAGVPANEVNDLVKQGFVSLIADEAASVADDVPSAIPADWRDMHHIRLIALAKKIAGDAEPEKADKAWATAVIETELAKAKAGEAEGA